MKAPRSTPTFLLLASTALLCAVILGFANVSHNIQTRLPTGWDETEYVNQTCLDQEVLRKEGFSEYLKVLISADKWRPPAYRMAAFPLEIVTEISPVILRTLTLGSFAFTALLLCLTGREVSSISAGITWAVAFSLSAGAYSADLFFGTETTLYPAIAGCLYAVARWLRRDRPDAVTLVILALSTAVGALSKVSFFGVFVPLIGVAALLAWRSDRQHRSLLLIGGAVGCGALAAAPWWLINGISALGYAHYAFKFVRGYAPWLSAAAFGLLGIPFAIFALVYFVWMVMRARSLWRTANRASRQFVIACLAACVPFLAFDIISVNHNMRLLTPALMPAMGVVGVTLDLGGLLRRKLVAISIALLFVIQALTVAWPAISNREDQWDWEQLRELAQVSGFSNPSVVLLGSAGGNDPFNPPQIGYPWICRGERVSQRWLWRYKRGPIDWNIGWLWRYEQGPIDWKKIDDQIDTADIVLTLRGFLDKNPRDNEHNDELARQLRQLSDVWKATDLYFGEDGKVDVLVFIRQKSHRAKR